jgi:type VI secretion system protein ImpH
LECVLSHYFDLPVQIEQFQGRWLYLSPEDQSCLPEAAQSKEVNNEVGVNVIVGERVWDVQSKFRVRLGPLSYREFCAFMPTGNALRPLCELTRSYVGPEFDFDVQPILKAPEVPWCRLILEGPEQPRLGWNTWIRCHPFDADVMDAVFFLDEV